MKYSRCARFLLTIVILIVCSGCWDYMEYESMALVRTIGMDIDKKGTFQLTYEIIKPQKQGKTKEVVRGTGKTVPEAFDNLQTIVPEELFLGYATTVILSEDVAKQQLKNILDLLFITPNIRESVFLVITKEKAEQIINMPIGETGELVGEAFVDYFKVITRAGTSFPVRVSEFNKMLLAEGVEPVAPLIKKNKDGKLMVSNIVVFKGFKPVGVLVGNESKGLSRITNQEIQELSSVSTTVPENGASVTAVFRLQDNKSKIKIKLGNELPEVFITTKVNATMVQFGSNSNIRAITPEILHACEKGLEENVKKELEATITKAQKEYKSDFLGIGRKFYQQHRKEWKDNYKPKWDEVFQEVPFHVSVKIKVVNSGTKVIPLSEQ